MWYTDKVIKIMPAYVIFQMSLLLAFILATLIGAFKGWFLTTFELYMSF